MDIDKTKPVKLIRAIYGTNNYFPGDYQPGELPEEYLTSTYVTQSPIDPASVSYRDATINQEISIEPEVSNTTVTTEEKPTVDNSETVNINTATVQEIGLLKNIRTQQAAKVVELREQEPFKDLEDLIARVPAKWADIAFEISF